MKMKYTKYSPGHFDGLINICSIYGGMFTIAGIIDSLLLKLIKGKKEVKGSISNFQLIYYSFIFHIKIYF